MIEYVQSLLKDPSEENLNRVNREIGRAGDIAIYYHGLLTQITIEEGGIIPDNERTKKILKQIKDEEELIAECREVAAKIEEALKAKK